MRLRTLLALVFAASALALTLAASFTVYRFVTARAQDRVEIRMADLAGQLHHLIDVNITERLGDMQEACPPLARRCARERHARWRRDI